MLNDEQETRTPLLPFVHHSAFILHHSISMFRQLLRRFVLPQLLIISILAGAIVWVAAIQLGHATEEEGQFTRGIIPVLLIALLAAVAAAVASTFAAYRFALGHVEDI